MMALLLGSWCIEQCPAHGAAIENNIDAVATRVLPKDTGVDGRRKFKGKLNSVNAQLLEITVDNQTYQVDFQDIDKANLVAVFD